MLQGWVFHETSCEFMTVFPERGKDFLSEHNGLRSRGTPHVVDHIRACVDTLMVGFPRLNEVDELLWAPSRDPPMRLPKFLRARVPKQGAIEQELSDPMFSLVVFADLLVEVFRGAVEIPKDVREFKISKDRVMGPWLWQAHVPFNIHRVAFVDPRKKFLF